MVMMLNPTFNPDNLPVKTLPLQPEPQNGKPGVEGMNPLMLVVSMLVGGGMWMGLFYVGHIVLQALSG